MTSADWKAEALAWRAYYDSLPSTLPGAAEMRDVVIRIATLHAEVNRWRRINDERENGDAHQTNTV